jgi:hypothetical protein
MMNRVLMHVLQAGEIRGRIGDVAVPILVPDLSPLRLIPFVQ